MMYKEREVISLTNSQLKEIQQCTCIDDCPKFVCLATQSEKIQFVDNEDNSGRCSYAKEDIFSDEIVVKLDGSLVDRPFRWTVQLDDGVHAVGVGAINHHCEDPNVIIDLERMAFVARKNIKQGEELMMNYLCFEKDMLEPFTCMCGLMGNDCYGIIQGFDHLNADQKHKLRTQLGVLPHLD